MKFKTIKDSHKAFEKAHNTENYNHVFSKEVNGYEFKVYNNHKTDDFAVKVKDSVIGYFHASTFDEVMINTQKIINNYITVGICL